MFNGIFTHRLQVFRACAVPLARLTIHANGNRRRADAQPQGRARDLHGAVAETVSPAGSAIYLSIDWKSRDRRGVDSECICPDLSVARDVSADGEVHQLAVLHRQPPGAELAARSPARRESAELLRRPRARSGAADSRLAAHRGTDAAAAGPIAGSSPGDRGIARPAEKRDHDAAISR